MKMLICSIYSLLIFCFLNVSASSSGTSQFVDRELNKDVTIQEGKIGTENMELINATKEFHYVYSYQSINGSSLRVASEIIDAANVNPDHPLRISVRNDKGSTNWHIPFRANSTKTESSKPSAVLVEKVNRTLCLLGEEMSEITIVLSTSSLNPISFKLILEEVTDFSVKYPMEQTKIIENVQVGSPHFHYVDLSEAKGFVQLKVNSKEDSEDICGMVSVQPAVCDLFSSSAEEIPNVVNWQTMLKLAAYTIKAEDYPKGLFLTFLTLEDNKKCSNDINKIKPTGIRGKSFEYQIKNFVTGSLGVGVEIALTLILVLGTSGALFIIAFCYIRKKQQPNDVKPEEGNDQKDSGDQVDHTDSGGQRKEGPMYVHELCSKVDGSPNKSNKSLIKTMFQQSDLYIWLVVMMGTFYGIPAVQLVFRYQQALTETGNNDLCYYNFLCSFPMGDVQDFNHLLSNIGYVAFGLTFVGIVFYRKHLHDKKLDNDKKLEREDSKQIEPTGIPQHVGIFYAMGFALISEGFLSACYHACPTTENFQFDTTFMYVIAVLCFIKIYQFRHNNASSNAYKVFFGIAMVMFLEVLGIFMGNTFFWILSLVLYFLAMLLLSSVLYQVGKWRMSHLTPVWLIKACVGKARDCSFLPSQISKRRASFIIILDLVNIGFILLGGIKQPAVSTYLLGVFIGNLLVYFFYYVTMKLVKKEKIPTIAYFISVLTIACWIPGIWLFTQKVKTTNLTPAESRNLNLQCIWGDLYDHHDIWHFFSAAGLFFSFILLLVIDDGIDHVPRNRILIF